MTSEGREPERERRRGRGPVTLSYFEDVLKVEFDAINKRREGRPGPDVEEGLTPPRRPVRPLEPTRPAESRGERHSSDGDRTRHKKRSPDPKSLFGGGKSQQPLTPADPKNPIFFKTRPRPVPCDAKGLAFSGGGIRSAAVCLGAMQALRNNRVIETFDYLSTVSGGGYIGACLSAAMSPLGGRRFPFGEDIFDSPAIAHLRNYSNYLMPRGRSSVRNAAEAAAIILRGLLANLVLVLAGLLACVLITLIAYPDPSMLSSGGFLTRMVDGLTHTERGPELLAAVPFVCFALALIIYLMILCLIPVFLLLALLAYFDVADGVIFWIGIPLALPCLALGAWLSYQILPVYGMTYFSWVRRLDDHTYLVTQVLLAVLAVVLIVWAVLRSSPRFDRFAGDTSSFLLTVARTLLISVVIVAFLDLQPILLGIFHRNYEMLVSPGSWFAGLKAVASILVAFAAGVSLLSSTLGRFLKASQRAIGWTTLMRRAAAHIVLLAAAMVLPVVLWAVYLFLWNAVFHAALPWSIPEMPIWLSPVVNFLFPTGDLVRFYFVTFLTLSLIALCLQPNGYSLHRFYRDRLSRAFLFKTTRPGTADPPPLDGLKLSDLRGSDGPYHIINAAMNVQGSREANRRGRNADFFMFTRDFIGSDLTMYGPTRELFAPTRDMEEADPRLDLGTAIAISGAAVSANMGGNTVRLLSPTLALLNIRLGYWLRNPRDLARVGWIAAGMGQAAGWLLGRFYLLLEMLNQFDEKSRYVYLSDGGHIENLGVYELLKRGCELIVVIDAEADSTMSFGSLLKLERYARIDLGVRITLPWEEVARTTRAIDEHLPGGFPELRRGPHCAIGSIDYENGAQGILVYFKSSLSGDEKDYILDYKRRCVTFPHETTGDQFFTEEQFETYRALGFHMVDGFFGGSDEFSFLEPGRGGFATAAAAMARVKALLPASMVRAPTG